MDFAVFAAKTKFLNHRKPGRGYFGEIGMGGALGHLNSAIKDGAEALFCFLGGQGRWRVLLFLQLKQKFKSPETGEELFW